MLRINTAWSMMNRRIHGVTTTVPAVSTNGATRTAAAATALMLRRRIMRMQAHAISSR